MRRIPQRPRFGIATLLTSALVAASIVPSAQAAFQSAGVTGVGISNASLTGTFQSEGPSSYARVYFGRAGSSFCLSNGVGAPEGASADAAVTAPSGTPVSVTLGLVYLAASTPYCAQVYTSNGESTDTSAMLRFTTLALPVVTRSKVSGLTSGVLSYGSVACSESCGVKTIVKGKFKKPHTNKPLKTGVVASFTASTTAAGTIAPQPKLHKLAQAWFAYLHSTRRDVHMTITTTVTSPDAAPVVDVYDATIKAVKRHIKHKSKSKKKK